MSPPVLAGDSSPGPGAWFAITRRLIDDDPELANEYLTSWKSDHSTTLLLLDQVRLPDVERTNARVVSAPNEKDLLVLVYERITGSNPQAQFASVDRLLGREREISDLQNAFNNEMIRITIITGIGGQGKTSLVRHVKGKSKFTSRWIDASNVTDSVQLVQQIQRALAISADGNLDSLIVEAHGNSPLIIIDNFESLMVAGRLPQPELKLLSALAANTPIRFVLVSRFLPTELLSQLPFEVTQIRLPGLDAGTIRQMLDAGGLPADDRIVSQVLDWSDGNPLAIKLFVGLASEMEPLTEDSILRTVRLIAPDIAHLIQGHLESLGLDDLLLIRRASWNGGIVDETGTRGLRRGYSETASSLSSISRLTKRNLLSREPASGTFEVHSLVREYVSDTIIDSMASELSEGDDTFSMLSNILILDPHSPEIVRQRQLKAVTRIVQMASLKGMRGVQKWKRRLENLFAIAGALQVQGPFLAANLVAVAKATDVSLTGLSMENSHFAAADFRGVDLRGTSFEGSNFVDCEFSDDFGPVTAVESVTYQEEQCWIAGTFDGSLRVWSKEGALIKTIDVSDTWISAIVRSEGDKLFIGDVDGKIVIVSLSSGSMEQLLHLKGVQVRSLCLYSGTLYAACTDGVLYQVDLNSKSLSQVWKARYRLKFVAVRNDGMIAVGGDDPQIAIIGNGITRMVVPEGQGGAWTRCGHFTSNGRLLVGDDAGQVRAWIEDEMLEWHVQEEASHGSRVWSLDIDEIGERVLTGGNDGSLHLWDLGSLESIGTLNGHSSWIRSIAVDERSGTAFSGGEDQRAILWQLDELSAKWTKYGYSPRIFCIAFLDESNVLCGTGDHRIVVFNLERREYQDSWSGHRDQVFAIDTGQELIISGADDGEIRLWGHEGQCLQSMQRLHSGWIGSVSIGLEGAVAASGADDKVISMINLSSGAVLVQRRTNAGRISGLRFLDRKRIVTSSEDGTVRIMNVGTLDELRRRDCEEGPLYTICVWRGAITVAGASGRVWTLSEDLQTSVELKDFGMPVWSVDADALSGRLVVGTDNGTVWYQAEGTSDWNACHHHEGQVWAVKWSPSGASFASAGQDASLVSFDVADRSSFSLTVPTFYKSMSLKRVRGLSLGERSVLRRLGAVL